jgi:hypothetical protein
MHPCFAPVLNHEVFLLNNSVFCPKLVECQSLTGQEYASVSSTIKVFISILRRTILFHHKNVVQL